MERIKRVYHFSWDISKEKENKKKHGIDFKTAAQVFHDCNRIEYFDSLHSEQEDRFITIGAAGRIVFVVYTEQIKTIRIISARPANKKERRLYYGN